jgi:3',5'-cyclic AMP phosphodiesterase CpdA
MIRSITHGTTLVLCFAVLVATAKEQQLTFRVEPAARLFNLPDNNVDNINENNAEWTNDSGSMEPQDTDTTSSTRNVFKILQLADLHWGEYLGTDKGKEQDDKTANAIRVYLETEQPDLVVLSGDQISSDFMVDNARENHGQVVSAMQNINPDIKWCTVMGNHDDHPFEVVKDGEIVEEIPKKTSRKELLEYDAQLDGSYTEPSELSNYKVTLSLDDGSPAADVYVFDTGGGAIEKELSNDQVEWFKNESNDNVARPLIGFMHIPTRKGFEFKSGCIGEDSEEVRKIENKPGILQAMVEQGHTHILRVGHNHGNDYCCGHDDPLHLCFGRHSGYGGYEEVSRGARVYELELLANDDNTRTFSWSSWVRLDTGETTNACMPERSYEYKTPLPPTQSPTNASIT